MPLWKTPIDLKALNARNKNTLIETLGIEFTAAGEDWLQASMPVDRRTFQPAGLLHGGASVALAETLGSSAATLTLDPAKETAVGLEINANHVRGIRHGRVVGTTRPLHIGRSTQVWEIAIRNEDEQLICISRLTMAVIAVKASAR